MKLHITRFPSINWKKVKLLSTYSLVIILFFCVVFDISAYHSTQGNFCVSVSGCNLFVISIRYLFSMGAIVFSCTDFRRYRLMRQTAKCQDCWLTTRWEFSCDAHNLIKELTLHLSPRESSPLFPRSGKLNDHHWTRTPPGFQKKRNENWLSRCVLPGTVADVEIN